MALPSIAQRKSTMPTTPSKRHTLAGSERQALPGARAVGAVAADERIEVTVRLRPKTPLRSLDTGGVDNDTHPGQRKYMTRDENAAAYGADPRDIDKVGEFAKAHGLVVVETNAARRSVVLSGDAQAMGAAFGVTLQHFEHDGGTYRGRTGPISVPADLAGVVEGVFGLDNRPQAQPHFQRYEPSPGLSPRASSSSYTPPALAKLYNFPTGL